MLVHPASLTQTIDNINEAFFFGRKITREEAVEAIHFICSQKGNANAYASGFGMTDEDMSAGVYTFTGELLSSPASRRHITTEEASRTLRLLAPIAKHDIAVLQETDASLLACIKQAETKGKPVGTYCCGPCTVSLWRYLSAGGLGSYANSINKGLSILKDYRDEQTGWRKFPFYYTLLALSGIGSKQAINEIQSAQKVCKLKLSSIKASGLFFERRKQLLIKALEY